jgi:3-carboxy-cis,cis-muconate cycloisomerase
MLDFESALARAEATAGIIPKSAAKVITRAAKAEGFDTAALVCDTLRAGTFGIPIAKALTERVRALDSETARFVHWGATSQDVSDTALVLLLKQARAILAADLVRLERALHKLAEEHRNTVMLGRTLLQLATPVTFGLKAAGWLAAIGRSRKRLEDAFSESLILQFGGASGTLASLGDKGIAIACELASELGLVLPEAPWHTHRDRLAGLICASGVLTGSLGKMARDISLLMQYEVSEAAEPGGQGRGGSSTMPHKRNPIGCAVTLAAAYRVPGEVANFLSAMVQEHERAVGGWQAEWPIVSSVVQSTGVAAASMAEVAEGLSVDAERMLRNINATNGAVFAERVMMWLGPRLGRDKAHKLLEEATGKSSSGKRLSDVLSEVPEIRGHLDQHLAQELESPEQYLGSAEGFRKALLASSQKFGTKKEK